MYVRNQENATSALEIASALGMIQHGRRVAQTAMTGFCEIIKIRENDFHITLPDLLADPEYYERDLSRHYAEAHKEQLNEALTLNNIQVTEKEIDASLRELVFPFLGNWIGYGANPLLDEYFFSMAHSKISVSDGIDTFHHSTCFGGIPYLHYSLALTYIVSLHEKHERFAEALILKDDKIKLENILTISGESSKFIQSIAQAVNYFGAIYDDFTPLTLLNAKIIFDVLSMGRLSPNDLWRPGCCTPLLFQVSDTSFIRCLSGTSDSPVQFMLNSLRLHFQKDYDSHQRKREKPMCNAIKATLSSVYENLEFRENVKIKIKNRILTDIDLTVYDPSNATVLLCQLKHQELYGSDLHAKHIRSTRLKEQAIKWLDSVDSWIKEVGEAGLRSSLNIKSSKPILTTYKVLITRHYAHPLNELALKNDTVFGNYLQLYNAILLLKTGNHLHPKLNDLITLLKTSQSPWGAKHHVDEPNTAWIIDDLRFRITTKQINS